ncbi:hypothetical protein F8A10_12225 [Paracoccus kondratievae]|uniref:hypothetical protein n=1 Tax=Paracoccus kondratievae TaxID=135740 RepID=UPI00126668EA|nr:hypothetical protein [Paracoccus kondratievae]QFQ88276.1 hypothetical protein F8A10_12225 [Paracoccus kondratievae]
MAIVHAHNLGNVSLPGSGYPPLGAFSIPYADRLGGAFFLGYGREVAAVNWGADTEVSIIGNPNFQNGYAALDGANYIETGVEETIASTLFLVFRETSDSAVGAFGNYGGPSTIGTSLYVSAGSTVMSVNTGRIGGTGGSASVTSDTSGWGIYSASIPATGQARLRNHVTGNVSVAGAATDRELNGAGPLRIGALYSASFPGASRVFAALQYRTNLSDEETLVVGIHLRQMAEAAGLTF